VTFAAVRCNVSLEVLLQSVCISSFSRQKSTLGAGSISSVSD